ncbi:MAG: hypothetical protein J0M36_11625 [Caulobacterales bacterium]|nr:hypothetical protein [Caulobacterales bacterium]
MTRIALLFCAIAIAFGLAGTAKNGPTSAPQRSPMVQEDVLNANCPAGIDDRKSDLCAQWKAADAAEESATWTRRTGIFTGIGLIVGAITMAAAIGAAVFAKEAASHTKRGSDAASAQVVLSEKSTEAALVSAESAVKSHQSDRPWLLFLNVQRGAFENGVVDDVPIANGLAFILKFANNGRSPALDVRGDRQWLLVPEAEPVPRFERRDNMGSGSILGPGHEFRIYPPVVLNDDETRLFRAGNHLLYTWVLVAYRDIYADVVRETELVICHQHNGGIEEINGIRRETINTQYAGDQQRVT